MTREEARLFVTQTLLPAMGVPGRSVHLEAPPSAGTRSSLTLVHIEGLSPLLMRAFGRRGRARRNAEALRHLEAIGLPAPRLIFHDPSRQVTLETWIDGTPHAAFGAERGAEARDAALRVADLLARLHETTRPTWGRPGSTLHGRLFGFASTSLRVARRMIRALGSRGHFDAAGASALGERFEAWRPVLESIPRHNLLHNDANRHNFVVTRSGTVMAVDVHRVSYAPFPEELVNALYHFCRKDPALAAEFAEVYFHRAGDEARGLFEATQGYFQPLNLLKKMFRRGVAPEGQAAGPDDSRMQKWGREVAEIGKPQSSRS